jgi:hypothetical protein
MNVRTPANRGYTLASMGVYLDLVTALEPTSVPVRDAVLAASGIDVRNLEEIQPRTSEETALD